MPLDLSKQCRPRSDCSWRSSLIRVYERTMPWTMSPMAFFNNQGQITPVIGLIRPEFELVFPIISQCFLLPWKTEFWSNLRKNLMQPFPHPSDATHRIWSRLANWPQRYSSSKVWMTTDRRLLWHEHALYLHVLYANTEVWYLQKTNQHLKKLSHLFFQQFISQSM